MHCRGKRISNSTLVEKLKHDDEISSGAKGTHTPSGRQRAGGRTPEAPPLLTAQRWRLPSLRPAVSGSPPPNPALRTPGPSKARPQPGLSGPTRGPAPRPIRALQLLPAGLGPPRRPDSLRMCTACYVIGSHCARAGAGLSLPPPAGVRAGRSPREAFPGTRGPGLVAPSPSACERVGEAAVSQQTQGNAVLIPLQPPGVLSLVVTLAPFLILITSSLC